jgi:SAM-dependent methyltransferase
MLKPYQRLSQLWDTGWSEFSIQYVNWINELLYERGIKRGNILDIACGTGALAIELARGGHSAHGIDISPDMIDIAKGKVIGLTNVSFSVQDMVSFDTNEQYDLVACTFDSLNYVRRLRDLRRMLFRVASVLRLNGLFVFDSNTKHLYARHSGKSEMRELNKESFIQQCGYDARRKEQTTTFAFSDGSYEIHKQRSYDYEELKPLLESAGFHTLHLFSWFEKIPYSTKTPKLFCVVEKRNDVTT